MSDYQQKISELLEYCQHEWVSLDHLTTNKKKEGISTPNSLSSLRNASRDLREGIKKLVHLQDQLDEIGTIVSKNTEWIKKADVLIEDVQAKLEVAKKLSTEYVQPTVTQSSPVKFNTEATTVQQLRRRSDSGVNSIKQQQEVIKNKQITLSTEQRVITTINGSKLTFLNNEEEEQDQPVFGQTSPEDLLSISKKRTSDKSRFLKSLIVRASQSTPVKPSYLWPGTSAKDGQAHINFYDSTTYNGGSYTNASSRTPSSSSSSATSVSSSSFIFATDATVDQPLRIGTGYSSYICYNCTVLSDKGSPITVRKRYSDFVDLRESLIREYPTLKKSIPKLPPKKVVGKFSPNFVEQRRKELEYFFKYIVLHPTLGASPIIKQWIMTH